MAHLTLRIDGSVIVPFGRLELRPSWRLRCLSEAADCERQRLSWPSPLFRQRREDQAAHRLAPFAMAEA